MNKTVALLLTCVYASFAPVCFASAIAPTQVPMSGGGHETHTHAHTPDMTTHSSSMHCHTCSEVPFDIVSAHAHMYSTITVPGSMVYVLVMLLLAVFVVVFLYHSIRTYAQTARVDITQHRHRARIVMLVLMCRLRAWISFLTRSPSVVILHA